MAHQVSVGQAVAVQSSYANHSYNFDYAVVKVTPKGQVVVKRGSDGYEMRFDADGYEMSKFASKYRRSRLVVDVEAARKAEAAKAARRNAAALLNAVAVGHQVTEHYGPEDMAKVLADLEAKIAAARAAVEAL